MMEQLPIEDDVVMYPVTCFTEFSILMISLVAFDVFRTSGSEVYIENKFFSQLRFIRDSW